MSHRPDVNPMQRMRVSAEHTEQRPAPCLDCGKETEPRTSNGRPLFKQWDTYIVTDTTWAEAGMEGWSSGFLCSDCLKKRLGRELTADDCLAVPVKATSEYLEVAARPEYIRRILDGRGY